jgi:diaminopimelate decarboxylase
MVRTFSPEDWGLRSAQSGELLIDNHSLVALAREYGTPLHVVHAARLHRTARRFMETARAAYPGKTSVHYAMKCNSVPGVVELIHRAGLNVEVTTEYELQLARHIGYAPEQIIVNGPGKNVEFLRSCLQENVRLIVVDSIEELDALDSIAGSERTSAGILLRVNPGYVPKGMNRGSATASRKGCAFGLDLKGGEVAHALELIPSRSRLRFCGFHMHIGTGIRTPDAYSGALRCLPHLLELSRNAGFGIEVLDLGGGIGSRTTRGMTTWEMALYEAFGIPPHNRSRHDMPDLESFFSGISKNVRETFSNDPLPELIFEPGRRIVSQNQFLLLTVQGVKRRPGINTWITADGGLSTVSMPTYYECHEVLLCNDVSRPLTQKVTLNGPACFAGDIIYKNKPMPFLQPGEVLAVMDSGAYFTALESSFGFPRPAIVAVDGSSVQLIRARETFEDMISRDILDHVIKEAL